MGDALTAVKKLKIFSPGTVPWQSIDDEIVAGRALGAIIEWENGFAHCVVITGTAKEDDGTEMVVVNDPAVDQEVQLIKYTDLLDNYSNVDARFGDCVDTYFTKK